MAAALEKLDAFAAGVTALPNILTNTWWVAFVQLGGIIGLVPCMLFVAKSERCKSLGKMAVAPAFCGVSEPVVFGIPSRKRSTKKAFNRKSCVNGACNCE
ncbi:hypothetical protein [Collinsella tanakaei]|uniref:hypothetical protein n=1 Tax=Collinsella tanakaei TaxID=626935 RepID=UPI0015F3104E|nr:hypothetical protein [Collinsella tanakaei]